VSIEEEDSVISHLSQCTVCANALNSALVALMVNVIAVGGKPRQEFCI
jgi:hypothetical protein